MNTPRFRALALSRRWLGWGLACSVVLGAQAQEATAESDALAQDDFGPVPVVLTATRLAQSLNDAPGAVTILDRDTIRRSGARTLAELLKWVPGYLVSGYNGANPVVAYHVPIDEYGARNLVLIDGRSLYASTYLAGTSRGMRTVLLDDIQRIEVLRGSNSAAYGANAMFGVINVVTRHSADTVGQSVSFSAGNGGVADASARLGWGDAERSHRLSLDRRSDHGYDFVHDDTRQDSVQWRGDLRIDADTELMLTAGYTDGRYGDGVTNSATNRLRTPEWNLAHGQAVWNRQLSPDQQVRFSFSWDEERTRDRYEHLTLPGVFFDYTADERRLNAEYQHQWVLSPELRAVWGAGWKQDSAVAPALFQTPGRIAFNDVRVFGHVEWRFAPDWLLNAGLFAGDHSETGGYGTPRLMFNHQITPDQVLRFGWTHAQREPTLFERRAHVSYFVPSLGQSYSTFVASGRVQPEALRSTEVGYFARFPQTQLTLDVRGYEERLSKEIKNQRVNPSAPNGSPARELRDFYNLPAFDVRGLEYQLKWQPSADTQWVLNQSFSRIKRPPGQPVDRYPPSHVTSVGWLQRLPQQWDLTVLVYGRSGMSWRGLSSRLESTARADARLAKSFRLGTARAEAALVVQALGGDEVEFTSRERSVFPRRAFATLNVEF